MSFTRAHSRLDWGRLSLASLAAFQLSVGGPIALHAGAETQTRTPIKHVVVIIGENRSFDHIFATYKPADGQRVSNLLSKQIIQEDGTPGVHYFDAAQFQATDSAPEPFKLSPDSPTPYTLLPPPNTDGAPQTPYFSSLTLAHQAESGLPQSYYPRLLTGGTGLPGGVVDTRIPNVNTLPPGPFQLSPAVVSDDYAASPVHRFYQMWQQSDCSAAHATRHNPAGCLNDLYPWVEVTIGAGNNGNPQPAGFNDETTREGSTAMGFYNVQQGDAPYLKKLAGLYAMSDNFHQSVMGGTGANHVALGTGDAIWYSDGKGNPATPPSNEIENPDPQPGTNNWYTQDGYGGGTYSACADATQPGVPAVVNYLHSLPSRPDPRCAPGHYYLLNNYAPGYFGDGSVNTGTFVIPPSSLRTIGDELLARGISWKYYGDQWDRYLLDPNYQNPLNNYCDICNPFQYSTSIMTNPAVRTAHLKDTLDLYNDVHHGTLPAVSFVKPSGIVDGHPASSKLDLFEGFVKKVVDLVQGNPDLWPDTAILVTFDESGGYYDSGYIQPLDFFGDGPRIPLIVVSPFSVGGRISHDYTDHVSILKFIEKNWGLKPVTTRSRDNFPNPIVGDDDPYVPLNGPAIGDLMDMFRFPR
jgi:phospholipase C